MSDIPEHNDIRAVQWVIAYDGNGDPVYRYRVEQFKKVSPSHPGDWVPIPVINIEGINPTYGEE